MLHTMSTQGATNIYIATRFMPLTRLHLTHFQSRLTISLFVSSVSSLASALGFGFCIFYLNPKLSHSLFSY